MAIDKKEFVMTDSQLSERETQIREVVLNLKNFSKERIQTTTDLAELIRLSRMMVMYRVDNMDWMWDYGGTTADEIIAEANNGQETKLSENLAKKVLEMKAAIETITPKEDETRVVLKRNRDKNGRYSYLVMGYFPQDSQIIDPIEGGILNNEDGKETGILFEPKTACVNHAADDLFKIHRDKPFYVSKRTIYGAMQRLNSDSNEYMISKTEGNIQKQETENYLLLGLMGGYSNERVRIKMPEFGGS